jgi:hypothetical protein
MFAQAPGRRVSCSVVVTGVVTLWPTKHSRSQMTGKQSYRPAGRAQPSYGRAAGGLTALLLTPSSVAASKQKTETLAREMNRALIASLQRTVLTAGRGTDAWWAGGLLHRALRPA